MGRNSAFGRPSATERAQRWWDTTSPASRQNLLLAVGVTALFVAIILAAVARDRSPASSRITSARPEPTSTVLFTPSTVFVGNLAGAAAGATTQPPASSTTTVTTTAPAARAQPTTTAQPATPPAPASTQAPAPVTTAVNPNVVYTEVPVETTTPRPATTTTVPTTLASTTTVPTLPSTSVPAPPLTIPGPLRL